MAKKVDPRNRDLGTITKRLPSFLWETSAKGNDHVPNLPGLKVGDKVKLVNGAYVINDGKKDEEPDNGEATMEELTALVAAEKERIDALEKEVVTLKEKVTQLEAAAAGDGK